VSGPPESLWVDTSGDPWAPRPSLRGDASVDVAIVGGGYTGLWTAYSLLSADPGLAVMVIEAEVCGYGASGRNGGWCSALFPAAEAAPAMRAAMVATVDEVGRVASTEGIDCDFAKGGTITLATNPAHLDRVRAEVAGPGSDPDAVWLDATAARRRLDATGTLGAAYTPHCAAIHPAKLVRGLGRVVEARGGTIVEGTRAVGLAPGRVVTDHGTVTASHVLRCTEGYTPQLRGERRTVVPLYSLMIATEPLDDAVWDEIGLRERETFTDGRHLLIYGQRTADRRIAFGGRGAPYHFGSQVKPGFDRDAAVFAELEATLRTLLPQIGNAAVTHRWGGPLAVPRDWWASVGHDRATGLGWAGGYVGDGVATTNLAGRTLADLVLGRRTELTTLPWVGHRSRRWEPEPLRWLGINLGRSLAAGADGHEGRVRRPDRARTRLMSMFTGGH